MENLIPFSLAIKYFQNFVNEENNILAGIMYWSFSKAHLIRQEVVNSYFCFSSVPN
jgi:hypothetical protein